MKDALFMGLKIEPSSYLGDHIEMTSAFAGARNSLVNENAEAGVNESLKVCTVLSLMTVGKQ